MQSCLIILQGWIPFVSSFPFVPQQLLVTFRSWVLYSQEKHLDCQGYCYHHGKIVFPFDLTSFPHNKSSYLLPLFDVLSSQLVHCICISLLQAHPFHSVCWSNLLGNVKEKTLPNTNRLWNFSTENFIDLKGYNIINEGSWWKRLVTNFQFGQNIKLK